MVKIINDNKEIYEVDEGIKVYKSLELSTKTYDIGVDISLINNHKFKFKIVIMNKVTGEIDETITYEISSKSGRRETKKTMNSFLITCLNFTFNKTDSKAINQAIYNYIKNEI